MQTAPTDRGGAKDTLGNDSGINRDNASRRSPQPQIAHSLADRGHDLYQTAPEATLALLEAERLPHRIWEPACGPGAIVRVLRAAGHNVLATDLVDYESPDQDHGGFDFLLPFDMPEQVDAIVTNPPFKLAQEFVTKALAIAPLVAMLLRLTFLESERRRPILDFGNLARVHVFRNRLPMMHRDGWTGPKATSTVAYAWFVWERDHVGPAELRRISWRRP